MNWILTKDRLPEIPKGMYAVSVLGTVDTDEREVWCLLWNGKNFLDLVCGEKYCDYQPILEKVIAWMYLPEPYRG